MDANGPAAWVPVLEGLEFLRCAPGLAWPAPPPGRRPRHVLLLADPEGRLAPADVGPFAEASITSGCCWVEIWGPTAHALEDAVDAVRDGLEQASPPSDDEEDHVVMTASSTPEEAGPADAVRMVLCATCSTEGHGDAAMSRLFVLASGDDRFAERLLAWLRAPETLP